MKIFKLPKYTDIIRGINKPLNQFEISIFFDIFIILGLPPELWSSTINGNIDDSSFLPSYQQSERSVSSVCLVWSSVDPLCPSCGYQICQMFTNPWSFRELSVKRCSHVFVPQLPATPEILNPLSQSIYSIANHYKQNWRYINIHVNINWFRAVWFIRQRDMRCPCSIGCW